MVSCQGYISLGTAGTFPGETTSPPLSPFPAVCPETSGQPLNKETKAKAEGFCLAFPPGAPTLAAANTNRAAERSVWWALAGHRAAFAGGEGRTQASPAPRLEDISAVAGLRLPMKFPR